MAAPKAPVLDAEGGSSRELTLEDDIFAADIKPHVVHETVRAELAARRAGTRALRTRGLVAGGRAKPWRQKGTGRARQGTIRAPHWTGGAAAFEPRTSFEVKVNRKVRRAALRAALTAHASAGTLGFVDASVFDQPSTRGAAALLEAWGKDRPLLVVATEDEDALVKSFRNLPRVLVTVPAELEVAHLAWARSLLISEAALPLVRARAGANGKEATE